ILGGKNSVDYYVHFEYRGKDQNGNPISSFSEYPLDITYYSELSDYTKLSIIPTFPDYEYEPNETILDIDFKFNWLGFTSLTLDSYFETFVDDKGEKTVQPTVSMVGNEIKLDVGESTTTLYTNDPITSKSIVIKGIPVRNAIITIKLSAAIKNELKGKTKAKYEYFLTFSGKDGKGNKVSETAKTILSITPKKDGTLTVSVTPSSQTFNPENLQKTWQATLNYKGKVDVTIEQINAMWYIDGTISHIKKNPDAKLDPPIILKAPSGTHKKSVPQTITDLGRLNMMKDKWGTKQSSYDKKIVTYGLKIEFEGKDAFGREVSQESNMLKVVLEEPIYPLTVTATPEKLTTNKESVDVSFTIKSNLSTPVTLNTRTIRIKLGTQTIPLKGYTDLSPMPGFKGSTTDETIGFIPEVTIPANKQYVDQTSISLNLTALLKEQNTVECVAEVEYDGKQSDGTAVKGKTYVPITVGKSKIVQEKDTLLTNKDDFVIIPKVAVVKAYKDLTTISKQGSNTVLNGPVQLILIPDPFDSQKVAVEATNLLFSPKQGAKDSWEIKSGSFSEEGSALKKDLFSIYMD
ncbi:MAG: hypothetical protein R3250_15560, partial [Melioribacteraceae bacterium]|nr:hypothetical protein [Melioribacteraceae bacterium]